MKNQKRKYSNLALITNNDLSTLKGGSQDDEEYIIVYIEGIPYRIKIGKNGERNSPPERIV
ncbi:hypothetical protein [Massilibacteroides sp.]|uniref:hypothetical protein n=1 Tax=Massilibacteroides sp. TaxID=2034766 RepID=UPI00260B7D32|nr:hypothetical protein [Massilibacteroides sp.]MDD4516816.1 hypothetical protein [Massilibacteroides sp.]